MITEKTSAGKLYRLEAVRGLAAVYVVVHHTVPNRIMLFDHNIGGLFRFGQEAVILFFILSGFVIQYSFSRAGDKSFGTYFLKRFYRIYIPLGIVFILGYVTTSYNADTWVDPNWPQLLGNLAMLQDWARAKPHVLVAPYLSNDPLWSLSYEWWFYMLFFPLVTLIRDTKKRDGVVYAAALCAAALYIVWPLFVFRILMYLAIWWTGAVAARAYLAGECRGVRTLFAPLAVLLGIVALLALDVLIVHRQGGVITLGLHPLLELRHFLFALLAISMAFAWRRAGWLGFDVMVSPFLVFAPVSYMIYIAHYHLQTSATYLDDIQQPQLRWIAYFSVLLLVSWLVERVVYPGLVRRLMASRAVRRGKLPAATGN